MNAPVILPSQIHEVTVHADGAVVRRRIQLSAVSGQPGVIRVLGVPLAAAGRAVRARVRDGSAEVLSCRLAAVTTPPEAADDRALEQAVESANAAVLSVQQRIAAALARLRALNVLNPPARPEAVKGQPPSASPAAARFELLRFRDQQAERLGADLASARRDEEQAGEQLAQAEAALRQASAARAARAGELRLGADLQLRWPSSGEPGWIELEYTVPGARWAPSYVLRFDRELGQVAIQLRGLVAQRSGEDWSGVRIACATAPLQGWCELPRLPGRRIGRAQPTPTSGWRPAPSGADALFADWDAFAIRVPPSLLAASAPSRPSPLGGAAAHRAEAEEICESVVASKSCPPPMEMPAPCVQAASEMQMEKKKMMMKDDEAPGAPLRRSSRAIVANAPSRMRKEQAISADLSCDDESSAEPERDEPGAGLEPGTGLLDFAALHLAAATDGAGRGRPRPGAGLSTDPRWAQACANAARRSADLGPPPPGHQPVSPARFAVRWEGDLPVEVPSDGGWHVVPLAESGSPVRLSLVVVPRESRTAFRSAGLTNSFDRALIAGPADIYVGADFLLAGRLPETGPGAAAVVGLGVEQTLAVARNASFSEESAGMLGGSLHLRHAVTISLHNKRNQPVSLDVRERLPQPDRNVEHCTVKQLKAEPPWEEWHPDDATLPGGRRWLLTLAAGEKRDLAYEYRVEIPSKNELVGGNRREA